MIEESAKTRKTGTSQAYSRICDQKNNGDTVIALQGDKVSRLLLYRNMESWDNMAANSGLIVNPDMRKSGTWSRDQTQSIQSFARDKYPYAKVFGITTSPGCHEDQY